ncbi:MAG: anti-sigma factor antagonist [Lachnospiraceae bacterium]|nr:anti-sigma factor antagonist [Lachnospiraceae bacterium]
MENFRVIDNCLMVKLPEEVDHYLAGDICEEADRLLMQDQVCHVVFDFEDTVFMDSSGIGVIMGRYKKISCFGGKVYAINVGKQIRRILDISGMSRLVEVLA